MTILLLFYPKMSTISVIVAVVLLFIMAFVGDKLLQRKGLKPVRSWAGKVITLGIMMIGLMGVSFASEMDCFRFEALSAEMTHYQQVIGQSTGLRRLVYLKKFENKIPAYISLGKLCSDNFTFIN